MSFGTFLWVALFQLRIWQYLLIFRWKQRAVGRYLLWPAIYVFVLIVPYTVAAILFPPSIGFEYFPENNDCVTKAPVYMFAIAIIVIELCSAIALTYLARNINTCFREFREIVIIISTTVAATVASIIVRWIPNTTGSKFYKGMLDTSFMLIAAQLYLIVLLSKPIYHSIVDPNEYVEYFMHRLRTQNLMQEYSISTAGQVDNLTSTLRTSTTVAASRHSWLGGPNRRENALNAYHALEEINEGHSSSNRNSNSNSNQYIRKLV
ncbi:hypothetical protein DL89DRAFT_255220 [Linderina pennispora]|uniref:G-protein coupled receptors family 3 profile domain-containing protein n=1 Tax=Linderina pennispora TaxID=61395 RepID=A0A1Y1WIZ8_9FUNG|nr:uncharacterized protein DL89DRAFT_255220 [Linderina pennispora]ORX73074.1 hypothetical protein DL89DRAFT_255220 [Linderina pennispora]